MSNSDKISKGGKILHGNAATQFGINNLYFPTVVASKNHVFDIRSQQIFIGRYLSSVCQKHILLYNSLTNG